MQLSLLFCNVISVLSGAYLQVQHTGILELECQVFKNYIVWKEGGREGGREGVREGRREGEEGSELVHNIRHSFEALIVFA